MRILKIVGVILAAVLLAALVMTLLGARLPADHTATASVVLPAPQPVVWQLIDDNAAQTQWRPSLKSVNILPPQNGHPCWLEDSRMGKLPFCEVAAQAPTIRVVQIADPKQPVGGNWVYELTPAEQNSTRLTITENGTTGPAIYRFLGHYIFHEDSTIKQFEKDLQKRLAQPKG